MNGVKILKTQNDWKKYIQNLIITNDKALYRAIIAIYNNQTKTEQNIQSTTEHNGIGFSGTDAEFMSSLAVRIQSRRQLTTGQIMVARKIMPKYWKQLMVISKNNIEKKRSFEVELI